MTENFFRRLRYHFDRLFTRNPQDNRSVSFPINMGGAVIYHRYSTIPDYRGFRIAHTPLQVYINNHRLTQALVDDPSSNDDLSSSSSKSSESLVPETENVANTIEGAIQKQFADLPKLETENVPDAIEEAIRKQFADLPKSETENVPDAIEEAIRKQFAHLPKSEKPAFRRVATPKVCKIIKKKFGDSSENDKQVASSSDAPIEDAVEEDVDGDNEEYDEVEEESNKGE